MTYKLGAAATSVVGAAVVRLAAALAPLGAGAAGHRFKALPHLAAAADHRGAIQAVGQWLHDPIGLPADPWRRTADPQAATVREQEWRCGRVARVVDPVRAEAIVLEEDWRCAQAARVVGPAKAEAIAPVAGYNLEAAGQRLVEAFDPAMATGPNGRIDLALAVAANVGPTPATGLTGLTGPAPAAAANAGPMPATGLTGRTGPARAAVANAGPMPATAPTGQTGRAAVTGTTGRTNPTIGPTIGPISIKRTTLTG